MKGFKKLSMLVCVLAMLLCMAGVAMAEDYHAYIGIQGNKYTFRNGWTEGNYGLEGSQLPEGYDYLSSGLIGWVKNEETGKDEATIFPATVKNATITGNGTFDASIEGIQWNGDDSINYIVLYTDLPISSDRLEYSDGLISHIIVEIDGKQVWEIDAEDQEEGDAEYGLWTLDEIWDSGDYAAYKIINGDVNPFNYSGVPESIRIVFTVEGMENDAPAEDQVAEPTEEPTEAPTEAPTEEPTEAAGDDNKDDNASAEPTTAPTQAPSSSDSSDNADDSGNMGLIIGIIVAVVVVVVIIVVVATKKKK